MKLFSKLIIAALIPISTFSIQAQAYPDRTIRLIVPYGAGGGTDTMARTIAPEIEKALGKKVIIVNRPGAQGQIGMAEVANSKPDGYTMGLFSTSDLLVTQSLVTDPGFSMDSFNYMSTINISANALVVKKSLPFNNYQDFVDYAKENPGKLTIGVSGHNHVYEVIRQENQAKIDLNFMHFSGGGESRNALLGEHVDGLMIDQRFIPSLTESGAKALAVASSSRFEKLPDVPTFKENNIDLVNASRRAIVLPLGVPAERVKIIMAALDTFSGSEEFKIKLSKINEVQDYLRSDEASKSLKEQLVEIKKVVDENIERFN